MKHFADKTNFAFMSGVDFYIEVSEYKRALWNVFPQHKCSDKCSDDCLEANNNGFMTWVMSLLTLVFIAWLGF
jgi:hypothetical protein